MSRRVIPVGPLSKNYEIKEKLIDKLEKQRWQYQKEESLAQEETNVVHMTLLMFQPLQLVGIVNPPNSLIEFAPLVVITMVLK